MSRAAVKKEVNKYVAKAMAEPEWFFEDFLKFPLLPWQYTMVNATLDVQRKQRGLPTRVNHTAKPRITVRSCHGTGKTQGMAAIAHIFNFVNYGVKAAATAPKQDQLLRRLLPRYRKIMKNAPAVYQSMIQVQGREITIGKNKDWGLALETATDPDNLAGYHDEPQLFLVDEASSKRLDPMFPTIEGALTTPGSVIVEIGNPTRIEGEFYQHHNRVDLADLYFRMHVSYMDAGKFLSMDWVNAMAIKYGVESPIYKIRVLGEFASFDESVLIPLEFIEEAMMADLAPDGSIPKLRVSIDVADGGADNTVITVAKVYQSWTHILCQKAYSWDHSISVIKAAETGITLFEAYGGKKNTEDDFVVDANGVGAGTAGVLLTKGYEVVRHVGGSESSDKERWRNRRVRNHFAMADAFIEGKVRVEEDEIDDVEEFKMHILAVKRDSDDDDKRDEIQTADKVKIGLGASPDRSASLSMVFHGSAPSYGMSDYMSERDFDVLLMESELDHDLIY